MQENTGKGNLNVFVSAIFNNTPQRIQKDLRTIGGYFFNNSVVWAGAKKPNIAAKMAQEHGAGGFGKLKISPTATIAEEKIRGYLLKWQPDNDKSKFLELAGYRSDEW